MECLRKKQCDRGRGQVDSLRERGIERVTMRGKKRVTVGESERKQEGAVTASVAMGEKYLTIRERERERERVCVLY